MTNPEDDSEPLYISPNGEVGSLTEGLEEDSPCDPPFPICCPKCSEPLVVYGMQGWCISTRCTGHRFEWIESVWHDHNEESGLTLEQLEGFEPAMRSLGCFVKDQD